MKLKWAEVVILWFSDNIDTQGAKKHIIINIDQLIIVNKYEEYWHIIITAALSWQKETIFTFHKNVWNQQVSKLSDKISLCLFSYIV